MTLSQALIGETVPPRERGKYQGYLSGMYGRRRHIRSRCRRLSDAGLRLATIFLVNVPLGLLGRHPGDAPAGASRPKARRCNSTS